MILSDKSIKEAVARGEIEITPFNPAQVNANSYDIRLGDKLMLCKPVGNLIDPKRKCTELIEQPLLNYGDEPCWALEPNKLYLASTIERTYTPLHVPMLHGKSSLARYGLTIHVTAGFGDVGFDGEWTLEITTIYPILLCPNMKIGQIAFHEVTECETPYGQRAKSKYNNQKGATASKYHENE